MGQIPDVQLKLGKHRHGWDLRIFIPLIYDMHGVCPIPIPELDPQTITHATRRPSGQNSCHPFMEKKWGLFPEAQRARKLHAPIGGGTLALALMLLLDATVGNLLLQEFSALTKCITKAFCVARYADVVVSGLSTWGLAMLMLEGTWVQRSKNWDLDV